MIPNGEKREDKSKGQWHYLAVKTLSALLRGVMMILLSELPSFFCNENKLESHKKVFENKDFCNIIVSFEDTKILEFIQYQKSDKAPFIVYADLDCIIEKIDGCKNNPENSFTTKLSEHITSGVSMSIISSFISIENKHDMYRGKDCMKKLCEFLRELTIKIIYSKKKNMKL